MNRRVLGIVVAALAALSLVGGCGKGKFSSASNTKTDNIFRYPVNMSPSTLDPHAVEDGDTIDILHQVYQGLVMWGPDSKVAPAIAESWEIKDGGTTYVFKIRKGVKFHNGREVKAEDCKWSLERACNPKLASPVAGTYLINVVGVQEKLDRKATDISGVTVTGEYELTIKIDKPRPYFLDKLTYLTAAVLPKESVPADSKILDVAHMVGAGPFKAKSYVEDQLFTLEAFADYWGGAPKIAGIERPIIKDATARLNKYRSGEVDMVQLERQDVPQFQKDAAMKDQLHFYDRPVIYYLAFAPNSYKPFQDKRVRQAFAMAVDKNVIVDEILGGLVKKANGVLPPGVVGYRENPRGLEYNVEKAKALLAEAGYPGGKGLPKLEFLCRDARTDLKIVSENILEQLKRNLGVEVNFATMEYSAFLEKRNRKELQMFHMRWGADYLDAENFLSTLLAGYGPENKIGYKNAAADALMLKADTMANGPERDALYAQAEDMILDDAPWLPLYYQRDTELMQGRVQGLRDSAFGHLPHTTVSFKE